MCVGKRNTWDWLGSWNFMVQRNCVVSMLQEHQNFSNWVCVDVDVPFVTATESSAHTASARGGEGVKDLR